MNWAVNLLSPGNKTMLNAGKNMDRQYEQTPRISKKKKNNNNNNNKFLNENI